MNPARETLPDPKHDPHRSLAGPTGTRAEELHAVQQELIATKRECQRRESAAEAEQFLQQKWR